MRYLFAVTSVCVALTAASTVADAAVTVIGSSQARSCYMAARSHSTSPADLALCSAALRDGALNRDDEVATRVNRGIILATRGDIAGAMRDYDAALTLNRNEPEAWLNKAFATLRSGDAAAAVPLFNAAVARRTREPAMAHFGRGIAYEETGRVRAAYADYVKARDLKPDWAAPQEELRRFKVDNRSGTR